MLLFATVLSAESYHLKFCINTKGHHNHRQNMLNIIRKDIDILSSKTQITKFSIVACKLERICANQWIANLYTHSNTGITSNAIIHAENAKTALWGLYRYLETPPLTSYQIYKQNDYKQNNYKQNDYNNQNNILSDNDNQSNKDDSKFELVV